MSARGRAMRAKNRGGASTGRRGSGPKRRANSSGQNGQIRAWSCTRCRGELAAAAKQDQEPLPAPARRVGSTELLGPWHPEFLCIAHPKIHGT